MADLFLTLSLISFVLFTVPTGLRKYFGAFGWTFLALSFFSITASYLSENEFVYLFGALLSLPVFYVSILYSLKGDKTAFRINFVAAVAFIIYAAVAFLSPVSDFLIAAQVDNTVTALAAIGHPASASAWDTILSKGYTVIITFSCTPVLGTAVMVGLAAGAKGSSRGKFLACLFAIISLAALNIIRLIFVVVAYSDQWFPYFLDIASEGYPGYESFYWAHNVIGRISFTILGIVVAGGGMALFVPSIWEFYSEILHFYYKGIKNIADTFSTIFKSN
ncbi:archaeosortase A (PGF-CTERM-specific) [Methanomicrobium sp. W14]|uniref:archaeosortase A n=1 Tax=Methanomicrobium sp. W14 TaxID=2817839 RepID=UPI001AE9DF3A|nr:archaeosortase A [Methanomicrobium sp. W14]MBP2133250.1 archaeosortase A (PGF-CTERM-specific) [Methanomicrobium sp. W14]